MKKVIVIILLGVFLTSCSSKITTANSTPTANSLTSNEYYTILTYDNNGSGVCILDVRLPKKISESQIGLLAEVIKESEVQNCSKLYISYYLDDDEPGVDDAWAYSFFKPELEVRINGLDVVVNENYPNATITIDLSTLSSPIPTNTITFTSTNTPLLSSSIISITNTPSTISNTDLPSPVATSTPYPTEIPMPTSTETATIDGPIQYVVQEGDTCWSIAAKFNVDINVLLAINSFTDCPIEINDVIWIPAS